MEIPHWNNGKAGRTEVDTAFLGDKVKSKTLHAAILMYQANRRVGTHDTKTRAEIARAKKPLFKQKGLGRGRVRHPQAPQCRGGGVAHGPHPRDYSYQMPKKARRVALQAALLSKFRDGQVIMAETLGTGAPKTKELAALLKALGAQGSCLIVSESIDRNLVLSARNLSGVRVRPAREISALDVLEHKNLLVTRKAFEALKEAHGHA